MWFDSWPEIIRTLAVGGAAYVALVLVLRVSGKRTLSQLNAFDFVVTVALGSTLATVLLSSDVAWAEGVTALALLAGLQFVIAWLTTRWQPLRKIVTSSPQVLLRDGRFDAAALRAARLTEAEIRQAVRSSGTGDLADVAAVVLESNGSISVISQSRIGDGSALADLDA
ncbi:MAG: DUF421 domain-containing protein [Actinomycetota bacterium]